MASAPGNPQGRNQQWNSSIPPPSGAPKHSGRAPLRSTAGVPPATSNPGPASSAPPRPPQSSAPPPVSMAPQGLAPGMPPTYTSSGTAMGGAPPGAPPPAAPPIINRYYLSKELQESLNLAALVEDLIKTSFEVGKVPATFQNIRHSIGLMYNTVSKISRREVRTTALFEYEVDRRLEEYYHMCSVVGKTNNLRDAWKAANSEVSKLEAELDALMENYTISSEASSEVQLVSLRNLESRLKYYQDTHIAPEQEHQWVEAKLYDVSSRDRGRKSNLKNNYQTVDVLQRVPTEDDSIQSIDSLRVRRLLKVTRRARRDVEEVLDQFKAVNKANLDANRLEDLLNLNSSLTRETYARLNVKPQAQQAQVPQTRLVHRAPSFERTSNNLAPPSSAPYRGSYGSGYGPVPPRQGYAPHYM